MPLTHEPKPLPSELDYRPENSEEYLVKTGDSFFTLARSSDGTSLGAQFGAVGDKPVAGDYDKDGKTDITFFRPSTAN
jgi:hypothetical protein